MRDRRWCRPTSHGVGQICEAFAHQHRARRIRIHAGENDASHRYVRDHALIDVESHVAEAGLAREGSFVEFERLTAKIHAIGEEALLADQSAWIRNSERRRVCGVHSPPRLHGVQLALSTDAEGELEWTPSFEATSAPTTGNGVEFEIEDIDLIEADLVYHDDVTGETTRTRLHRLRLDLDDGGREAELQVAGALDDVEFELEGRFERLTNDPRDGLVGKLEGRVEQGRIEAAGTVVSPLQLRGVDLEFTAQLTEPLLVGGLELPPAVATGRLRDSEGQLGLEDLEIELERESNRLSVSGRVRDLIGDPQLELVARVELEDASLLAQLGDLELPDLGPIHGSALLTSADGAFHLAMSRWMSVVREARA